MTYIIAKDFSTCATRSSS